MKKSILFISYFFAPRLVGGAPRSNKFVKYLAKQGWKVTVITTDINENYSNSNETLKDIPDTVTILRYKTPDGIEAPYKKKNILFLEYIEKIRRFIALPDERYLWTKIVFAQLKKQPFTYDLVFTTSPPSSMHRLGYNIKKHFKIPWVADFRDPWTRNRLYDPRSLLHRIFDFFFEKKIYSTADHIIENTQGNYQAAIKLFPQFSNKLSYIYNGYDESDLDISKHSTKNNKFTISYTGQLYGGYNAEKLFKTLQVMKTDSPETYQKIQFNFYGDCNFTNSYLKEQGLADVITVHDYVGPDVLKKVMQTSDAFLLFLPDDALTWLPQKTFIYIPQQKPIFAFIPENSEAAAILKECGYNTLLGNDIKRNLQLLTENLIKWKNNALGEIAIQNIEKYSRKSLTKQLETIFKDILKI